MSKLAPLVFGSTISHSFTFKDGSGNTVDLTGGSVSVVYTATDGTTITKTATLSGTPSVAPQASVTLQEADYTAITPPFDLIGKATATVGTTVFVEDEFIQPVKAAQGFGANGSLNTYSEAVGEFGSSSERGVVEQHLKEAYDTIRTETGREFVSQSRVEYHDGVGSEYLFLKAYPVTSITSIAVLSPDGTETALAASEYDFDAKTGIVALTGSLDVRGGAVVENFGGVRFVTGGLGRGVYRSPAFDGGFRRVKVTYTGGYTAANVPSDLKRAEMDIAKLRYNERGRDAALSSESLGDYSYSRDASHRIEEIVSGLARRYRRMVVTP